MLPRKGKNRKALDEGRVWVMMKLWQLNRHGYQQLLVTVCVSSASSGRTVSIDVFFSQASFRSVSACLAIRTAWDALRVFCAAFHSLSVIAQEEAPYLITNVKWQNVNAFCLFLTIALPPPLLPTIAPSHRAANEERTVPHASAINAAENGSVSFHTSHLKLSCFLHR